VTLDDVKAPNVFERVKEKFEAIAQVFHHNNETSTHDITLKSLIIIQKMTGDSRYFC